MTDAAPCANDVPVLLITGAAKRLGAAIAERFHEEGHAVILHYHRSMEQAQALQRRLDARRPGSIITLQADLCDSAAVTYLASRALAWRGRIDTLINNASAFYPTPFGSITEKQWDDLLGSNLKGAFFLSQALAPALHEARGCIINLADIHADSGLKSYSAYSIAKAGVKMMTRVLANELAPQVRVNGIAPGAILWPEAAATEKQDNAAETAKQAKILGSIALGHTGAPADIAGTAWFLASNASYMSGQTVRVAGGRIPGNSL